jgi:hypothetical protein
MLQYYSSGLARPHPQGLQLGGTAHQELQRVSNKISKALNIEPPNLEHRKLKAPTNPLCFVEIGQYIAGRPSSSPVIFPFEASLAMIGTK